MRALIVLTLVIAALAAPTTFQPDNCPDGCSCGMCTATCTPAPTPVPPTPNPTPPPTPNPTPFPTTKSPTNSPTATPTATPTSPVGACCGMAGEISYCIVVDENDCAVGGGGRRDTTSDGAPFNGDSWTEGANCQSACGTGVPVTSGNSSFSVDAANAGLGATGGIALAPKLAEDLPTEATNALNGRVVVLAFEVHRFEGGDILESDFLAQNNYIWVDIQAVPEIIDPNDVTVLRFDEDSEEWVDIQMECTGKIQSTDFILDENTDPNTLRVPLCHTSTFVLTAADADDKDTKGKKKTKKAKVPTKTKDTKAAKSGKKGKAGKKASATTNIALGVGIGGGALVAIGAGVAYKCRNGKKDNKQTGKKSKRGPVAAPPAGAMTV